MIESAESTCFQRTSEKKVKVTPGSEIDPKQPCLLRFGHLQVKNDGRFG